MTRYAVLGHPVAHSKSPGIHRQFAEQTGQELGYEAIDVAPEAFAAFVRDFFASGGGGLNITLPHKEEAFALAETLAPRARLARAVNTMMLDSGGRLHGDNTDGVGLVRDIENNLQREIAGSAVLILGAGGAARGALPALLDRRPGSVTLLNRTLARAQAIQDDFADVAPLQVADFDSFSASPFDLIINATSMGLSGQMPPLPAAVIGADTFCYDMAYGATDTAFVTWARSHGAAGAADGLGMLVEQAAESFYLWRGVRPETAAVLASLRD
ncbi:MAG: shikimate dehydrogenase [Pseudohongiellaceae bacterium]